MGSLSISSACLSSVSVSQISERLDVSMDVGNTTVMADVGEPGQAGLRLRAPGLVRGMHGRKNPTVGPVLMSMLHNAAMPARWAGVNRGTRQQ